MHRYIANYIDAYAFSIFIRIDYTQNEISIKIKNIVFYFYLLYKNYVQLVHVSLFTAISTQRILHIVF